jgi:hypothetical protein
VIYTFWNLWRERNRRIFDNKMETVLAGGCENQIGYRAKNKSVHVGAATLL